MMIFKKAIPRRTFLRGLGAAVALPLLDAMVPAFAKTLAAGSQPPSRFSVVYFSSGLMMNQWTPEAVGPGFAFTPIMQPLSPFRDRLLVMSGLALRSADAWSPSEGGPGAHARSSATFLSGVHPKKTEGADIEAGTTIDQIVAADFGKNTQLPSLELALEDELVGQCERGYHCVYLNTISWHSPTTPMPMETQPRQVFERLFGAGGSTSPEERLARLREKRSILDLISQQAAPLLKGLDASDRLKMTQYFDAVRDIEQRIQRAEDHSAKDLPASLQRPVGMPDTYEAYAKLMFDLQIVAYQTDLTRVVSTMMAREQSLRAYPEIGVSDAHHPMTHHNGDPEKIAKVIKINIFHMKTLAYFLEKLRATPDGDGSLLDHTTILCGSAISDGNIHAHSDLPVFLFPAKGLQIQGGRHLRYPKATPLPNLYLTLLDKLNLPVEKLGDSTGKLDLLSV